MRNERGVTLVELMVVVVILGILASLAVSSIKSDPTAKTAREVAVFIQQARRYAIAHGPVATIASAATQATEKVVIRDTAGKNSIEVYDLVDTSSSPTWRLATWSWMPQKVQVYGVSTTANSTGGETLPTALATNGVVEFYFFPDGTVGSSLTKPNNGVTIYLQTRTGTKKDKFRIFVMPLSGAPTTTKGW